MPAELTSNFTLVHESRSPFKESISLEKPRVILFSKDGRLVLTFTGDPAKPGYDVLETLAFDDRAAQFRLQAHVLPAAVRRGRVPSAEAMACARCHGQDSRPIFDSYPLWPGFYGSIRDTFPQNEPVARKEGEAYVKFLGGAAHAGVYAGLRFPLGSPVTPFLDPAKFEPGKLVGDLGLFKFLPNTRLGMALSDLNRKRIYRKLASSEVFRKDRKGALARWLDCPAEPVPAGLPAIQAEVRGALERENEARLKRLGVDPTAPGSRSSDMQELQFTREIAELASVARSAGADMRDWSMALEPGSLAFFDGILSGIHEGKSYYIKEDLIFETLRDLASEDAGWRPYFRPQSVYAYYGYPFAHRVGIGPARAACPLLTSR